MTNDLAHRNHFLGIAMVLNKKHGAVLGQSNSIEKLLVTHGTGNSTKVRYHTNPAEKIPNNSDTLDAGDASHHRNMVSSFPLVTLKTRPDMVTAGSILGTFVSIFRARAFCCSHKSTQVLTRYRPLNSQTLPSFL